MARGVAHEWTPERDARLIALWREGCHVIEIAMMIGASPRAVHRQAAALGLPPRLPGPASPHPPEARALVATAARVMPITTVAAMVRVSPATAWRWAMASRWGRAA